MNETGFFDYKSIAREMNIPEAVLKEIEEEVRHEFPQDTMLFELHMLRAVKNFGRESKRKAVS